MGNYAASGGYYIACNAKKILQETFIFQKLPKYMTAEYVGKKISSDSPCHVHNTLLALV